MITPAFVRIVPWFSEEHRPAYTANELFGWEKHWALAVIKDRGLEALQACGYTLGSYSPKPVLPEDINWDLWAMNDPGFRQQMNDEESNETDQ